MGVTGIAREFAPEFELRDSDAPDTNSTSDDPVNIAERISTAIEDFVSGMLPGRDITISWSTLSPMFSTLGDVLAAAFVITRWL